MTLKNYLNISEVREIPNEGSSYTGGDLIIMHEQNVAFLNTKFAVNRYNILPWGMGTTSIAFGTFFNETQDQLTDLMDLAKPFRNSLWLTLMLAIIILILCVKLINVLKKEKSHAEHIIFILMDQYPHKFLNSSKPGALICTLWVFATMILNNAYTGRLYEYLTAPSIPFAPGALEEIPAFASNIFTFATAYLKNETVSSHYI